MDIIYEILNWIYVVLLCCFELNFDTCDEVSMDEDFFGDLLDDNDIPEGFEGDELADEDPDEEPEVLGEEAEVGAPADAEAEELEAFTAGAENAYINGIDAPSTGPSARKWIFTLFRYTHTQVLLLRSLIEDGIATHLVLGFESAPTTGLPHIQGYVSFKTTQRGRHYLQNLVGTKMFVEVARNPKACIKYSKKTTNFDEYGQELKQGERTDLQNVATLAETAGLADVIEAHPVPYIKFHRGIEKLVCYKENKRQKTTMAMPNGDEVVGRDMYVSYRYGSTGTGKTHSVWAERADGMVWTGNQDMEWFDGYMGDQCVLFDDFRDCQAKFGYLLRILDKYPMRVPVKGGFVNWLPTRIYITSDVPPWELYKNVAWNQRKQLFRRINEVRHYLEDRSYVVEEIPEVPPAVAADFNLNELLNL
jgi:hypothetical protein